MFLIHTTCKGFIHIPRTAGSFIESQCQSLDSYEKYHTHHADIPNEFLHYEWHTVVRDPVERFVSLYRFNQMTQKMSTHNGDFASFIDHVWNKFEYHTRPQVSFINKQTHCYIDPVDCVHALGGKVTGGPINRSKIPTPFVSKEHKTSIEWLYSQDLELFLSLKNRSLNQKNG